MPINWEEAPADATHAVTYMVAQWWFKVEGDRFFWWVMGAWKGPEEGFNERYVGKQGWVVEERPKVQEKIMFTVKDVRNTEAYAQLRGCVEASVEDVKKRPSALGRLTRRLLHNLNNRGRDWGIAPGDNFEVSHAFDWGDTPEGRGFWSQVCGGMRIDNLDPVPLPPLAKAVGKIEVKAAQKVPAPPKRLGWWAN